MRKNGWSQDFLAKKTKQTAMSISYYENNKRKIPSTLIPKLCTLFNCTSDELLGIEKENLIKIYGKIPAGIPFEMITDIIGTEEIDIEMLKGGKKYFGLQVSGDSMFPTYLDKDILICEQTNDTESGKDCIVTINGNDATFKKIIKKENGVVLQPINPNYEPMFYTNDEIEKLPIRIIGVVREIRRKI